MKADWVKQRNKVIRRLLNTLKVEEREMADKGIVLDYKAANEELRKLLAIVDDLPVDRPQWIRTWRSPEDE